MYIAKKIGIQNIFDFSVLKKEGKSLSRALSLPLIFYSPWDLFSSRRYPQRKNLLFLSPHRPPLIVLYRASFSVISFIYARLLLPAPARPRVLPAELSLPLRSQHLSACRAPFSASSPHGAWRPAPLLIGRISSVATPPTPSAEYGLCNSLFQLASSSLPSSHGAQQNSLPFPWPPRRFSWHAHPSVLCARSLRSALGAPSLARALLPPWCARVLPCCARLLAISAMALCFLQSSFQRCSPSPIPLCSQSSLCLLPMALVPTCSASSSGSPAILRVPSRVRTDLCSFISRACFSVPTHKAPCVPRLDPFIPQALCHSLSPSRLAGSLLDHGSHGSQLLCPAAVMFPARVELSRRILFLACRDARRPLCSPASATRWCSNSSAVVVLSASARDRGSVRRVRQRSVADSIVVAVVCFAACSPSVIGCTSTLVLVAGLR
jgi:hypothetical protein